MKVPVCLDGAVSDKSHVFVSLSPLLEMHRNNAELAFHNAFLMQQNDIMMRNLQHLERSRQAVQRNQILAGPPGLTREPCQHLRPAMATPPGLTKELVSNHSDDSTTCSLCDEVSSTHSETQMGDEKPLTQVIIKHLRSDFTRETFLDFLH